MFEATPSEKVVIFTQFLQTQEMIRERLASRLSIAIFHGNLNQQEKDKAIQDFKHHAQVLISTEAGGEGRNLQFAHILVNYDLPWNPMRIEQRIGRLDRVGQKENVLVYNLAVNGTIDEQVLDVLEKRIQIFTESVGALDQLLGEIEARLTGILLTDRANAARELARYELDIEERVRLARAKEEQMRDLVMDTRSFRRDEVASLLGQEPLATPLDLERYVRASLVRFPTANLTSVREGVLGIDVPEVLRTRVHARLHRELLDYYQGTFLYRTALEDERLDFFAFGHPLVDALVEIATTDDFIAPLGALQAEGAAEIAADYELEFEGINTQTELLSVILQGTSARLGFLEANLPGDPNGEVDLTPIEGEVARRWQSAADSLVDVEVQQRLAAFQRANAAEYEHELQRSERRTQFAVRFLEQQVARETAQVELLEKHGTGEQKRVIPALQGRIRAARRRIEDANLAHRERVAQLDLRKVPSFRSRLLTVGRVLQPEASVDLDVGTH